MFIKGFLGVFEVFEILNCSYINRRSSIDWFVKIEEREGSRVILL